MINQKGTHFQTYARNLIFFQRIVLYDICKGTALHVFHDDPEFIVLHEVRLEEVDNVGVLGFLHDEDLVHDQFLAWLV